RRVTKTFTLHKIPFCKSKEEYEAAKAKRDVSRDVIIHAGTDITVSPWVTHRLESVYKDAMRFNPDRYKNASVDFNENCEWLPFGAGPRNCPGRRFAVQEAKLFSIEALRKYDFTLSAKGANVGDADMRATLKHAGELQLNLTERNTYTSPRCVRK
ncbi:MAG: cytochrome P450, partial [Gammaproteobacteria bacterium]|nr:cytochrome P450 [Gammaproteobacteria bacterium]